MSHKDEILNDFGKFVFDIDYIRRLSMSGIFIASKSIGTYEALLQHEMRIKNRDGIPLDEEKIKKERELAKEKEEYAINEVELDFPIVHSHAVIALWNGLENFIHDLSICAMEDNNEILRSEDLLSIKISIAEYLCLDDEERLDYIYDQMINKARYKIAIARFEEILSLMGYKAVDGFGEMNHDLKKTLIELQNVRNVLVHRGGIIDRKFIERCPWLNYSKGEKINITQSDYKKYNEAIGYYWRLLLVRDIAKIGKNYKGMNDDLFHGEVYEYPKSV